MFSPFQIKNADRQDPKSAEQDAKSAINTEGGVVPHVTFNLGMEQASVHYLDLALGIWDDILCNGFKLEVFHDLSTTCQCLKLMASVYELTQRVSLMLRLDLVSWPVLTLNYVYAW